MTQNPLQVCCRHIPTRHLKRHRADSHLSKAVLRSDTDACVWNDTCESPAGTRDRLWGKARPPHSSEHSPSWKTLSTFSPYVAHVS